jgi:flagellar basal-body rod protein FlgC
VGPIGGAWWCLTAARLRNFRLLLAGPFSEGALQQTGGVRVSQVVDDPTPPLRHYEPGHPDADASGYVDYPAINPLQEMVDLMGAQRAYELNSSAVQAAKQMIQQSLQILK